MRKILALILLAVAGAAYSVPPSTIDAAVLPGNLLFSDGGVSTEYLYGPFVKSASVAGDTLTIIYQGTDSMEAPPLTFTAAGGGGLSTVATRAPVSGDGSTGDPVTIGDGTIGNDKIFEVEAGKLTGTLLPARIPNLSAGKITSDTFADARIPDGIARDSELPTAVDLAESGGDLTLTVTMIGGNLTDTVPLPADTVRSDADIDARISDYARASPTGEIADAQIPDSIARDSELPSPDGVVIDGEVTGTTLTLMRSVGANVQITGLPSGGGGATADGVVTSAEFALSGSDVTLTLERSESLDDVVSNAFTLPSISDALTAGDPLPAASAAGRTLLYGDANLTSRSADGVYFRKHHADTSVKVRMDLITSRALSPEYNIAVGFANRSASGIYGTGGAVTPSVPNGLQAILWTHHRIDSTYQWRLRVTNDLATPSTLYLDIRDRDDDTFIQNVEVVRASGDTDHLSAEYATVADLPFRHAASVHDNMRLRIRTADNQNDNSLVGLLDDGDDVMTKLSDTDDEQSTIAEGHRYAEAVRADLQANIDNLQTSADLNGKADIDLQNISLTTNEAAAARFDLGLGTSATRDVGTTSGRVAVLDSSGDFSVARMPLSTMFRGEEINVAAPSNEDDTYGSTQQRIAEALAEFGLDDVTITRSINTFTVTITSPDGSTYSDAFDISTTDELSQLESLLSQLIEASGFHPDHDLVLADIINVRHLISQTLTGQDRRPSSSVIDFTDSQVNIFLYDVIDGTDGDGTGLYFNTVQIADLPPLAGPSSLTLDNYGGATRVSFTSLGQPDRYVWAAGDDIVVRNVDSDATKATSWRTLFGSPDPWFSVALDADGGDIEAGATRTYVWQLLHNRTTEQLRICVGVVSNTSGDTFNTITVPSCVTYGLADINGFLADERYMDLRQLYDQDNGVVDVSASRNHLFVMIDRVVPNPSHSQASFVSLLLGFDFAFDVSGHLVLTRRQSLDHEVLPSTNIRSIEVIAHENVNFIEDVFTFTGTYNIWHYRDPDQIRVRWENVTGKPEAAASEEMTLGTETSIRLMSPANVAAAIDHRIEGAPTGNYYAIARAKVGGTANAITLTTGESLSPVPHGSIFFFEAQEANTGGVTIAVDGQQARNVNRSDGAGAGTELTGGEITASDPILVVYESEFGLFHWIPGHMGLLAQLNAVSTDSTLTGGGTPASPLSAAFSSVTSDGTLTGDGTAADPLAVNEHDIITQLTENVHYFTDPPFSISDRGATIGHRFTTSPHRKTVYRVNWNLDAPAGDKRYRSRIFAINENRRITSILGSSNEVTEHGAGAREFNFGNGGVDIAANQRVAIVLSRTHAGDNATASIEWGSESSSSPAESYDDASVDFANIGYVEYRDAEPDVGDDSEGHGTDIHGNPQIFYRITFNHGAIVGTSNTIRVLSGTTPVDLSANELRFDADDFEVFVAGSSAVIISTIGGGGGTSTDLENVATNIQPDADNTRSVGTSGRTFNSGRFTNFIIDDTLHVGGDVSNDLVPDADGSHDVGTAARTWGGVRAVTVWADQNMRLGTQDMSDSYVSHSLAGRELTFTQADGSTTAVTLPSGTPGGDPVVYKAHLDAVTVTNLSATWVEVTQIDAANDIEINDGSFTTVTQSDTTERVCVPQAGVYEVTGHVAWEQTENVRSNPVIRTTVDGVGQSERAYSYARGIVDQSFGSLEMSLLLDLNASECVALQIAEGDTDAADTADFLVLAGESFIELSLQQAGPAGPAGPAGAADGVADSVELTESGGDLTITLGLTVGDDLTDTVTLPAGGGGGTSLTQAQVEDDSDVTFGTVSGERLQQSVEANVHDSVVSDAPPLAGDSAKLKNAAFGDTRLGQHFSVAPVGETEAVKYRSVSSWTFGTRAGARLITGGPMDGDTTIGGVDYDRLLPQRVLPADIPAYMSTSGTAVSVDAFQLSLVGTDTPYLSVNTSEELRDWENIVIWIRVSRADDVGITIEGAMPWNADVIVGADVRGDPYSARESHLRTYLGLPSTVEHSGVSQRDADLRRALFGDGVERTFNETFLDWLFVEDGFDFGRYVGGQNSIANAEINSTVPPTQTILDSYTATVEVALVDASDPRIDWRLNSVIFSAARVFTETEKTKLATAPTFSGTPSAGDVPIWNTTDEEAQWGAQIGGGGGGGLSAVASDASLTGDGTSGDPLGIATDGVKLTDLDRFDAQTAVSTSGVLKNYSAAGAIGYGLVHSQEISSVAATKLTGTIADARIPSGIARDSELSGLLASGTFITSSDTLRLTTEGGTNTDLNLASSLITGVSAGDGLSGGGPGGSVRLDIDVHDVARSSSFEAQDRWVFSDEGTNNDPTSYSTMRDLYNGIVDVVTTSTSAVADTDIWFFADDSQSGDPLVRIVFADLRDLILADAGGSLATTLVGSSNSLNITTANRLNATGITGWAEHDWIVVNLGGAYGKWLWVRVDQLTDLAAATDNAALSATNVLEFPDVVISNTDVYMGRTVGNELLVGASAAVNLAGFTVRGITEGAAGGGTGTNVVANPGGTPNSEIRTITVGNTDYAIAHPHRGDYDDTLDYLQGDITETGSDRTSDFWIARTDIGSGGGSPSQANLGMWWHLAGHGVWRGVLNDTDQYDIFRGDTWETDGEVWIALEDTSSRPASELNGSVSAIDVRPITNPLRIDSQGGGVVERFTESLVFRGTGIVADEIGTTQEVEIIIPMTSPIGNDTRTLSTTAWTDTGAATPDAGQLVSISMLKGNDIVSFQVSSDILRTRSIALLGTSPTTANALRVPVFQPSTNDADFIWLTRQVVADRDQLYVRASSSSMAGTWRVDVFQVN